ncbi:MAG TPA: hypothetical protein VM940_05190 [Chthoniobacterales bacterium]|nr:hypothetical protein [Chthoniobacterales bacterium]
MLPSRVAALITKGIALALCLTLAACASDRYSFIDYSQQVDPRTGVPNSARVLKLNDVLALNYASSVTALLRAKYTGARITREISSTAQIGLASAAAYGAAFSYSASTLAVLGLGSAGIPELQRLFGAKERAQTYQDAIRLIEEAEIEYLSLNQNPSSTMLTQNGVTLLQRVTASIHIVEKTLAGNLPTVEEMHKATERMSREGAVETSAGAPAFNNRPANADPDAADAAAAARGNFEKPIHTTTVTIPDPTPRPQGAPRNRLRARVRKLTDAAAQVMIDAGRQHADLKAQFDRTPQNDTAARNYLFHLIDSASDNEIEIWRAIIPVRPAVEAAPTPATDPALPQ